jgi:molybdenum cofactor cytidylyltransferase
LNLIPDCIIAAAGRSSRMQLWKPGLPWGNMTIVEKVVSEAMSAGCRVIVVGGFRYARLKKILADYDGVSLVRARGWRRGMDVSVRSALDQIQSNRFFIVAADMPMITRDDYLKLADFNGTDVIRPSFAGKPGHPVLLDSSVSAYIRKSPQSIPIKHVLEKIPKLFVPWDHDGVIRDIDTLDEYFQSKP